MSEPYVTWTTDKDGNLHLFGEDGEVAIGPTALAALAEQIVTPAQAAEVLGLSAEDLTAAESTMDGGMFRLHVREAARRVREAARERGEE